MKLFIRLGLVKVNLGVVFNERISLHSPVIGVCIVYACIIIFLHKNQKYRTIKGSVMKYIIT